MTDDIFADFTNTQTDSCDEACSVAVVSDDNAAQPIDIEIAGCDDYISVDAGSMTLGSGCQMIDLRLTVKDVCPGKKAAVAVALTEVSGRGKEIPCGLKAVTIENKECFPRNIRVEGLRFVLPDEIGLTPAKRPKKCLRARVFANYMTFDTDII